MPKSTNYVSEGDEHDVTSPDEEVARIWSIRPFARDLLVMVVALVLTGCGEEQTKTNESNIVKTDAPVTPSAERQASDDTTAEPDFAAPEEAIASLKAGAKEYRDSYVSGDFDKFVDVLYPSLLRLGGGRAATLQSNKTMRARMVADGYVVTDISMREAKKFSERDSKLFAIVPNVLSMDTPLGGMRRGEFLVAISDDNGQSWKFVAGENLGIAAVRKSFPDLPDQIAGEYDARESQVIDRLVEMIMRTRTYQDLFKGRLPDDLEALAATSTKGPWGNELIYRVTDSGFAVRCAGRDGMADTDDDTVYTCPKSP